MTYTQARIRVAVYLLLSWSLRAATGLILLTAAAKGFIALNEMQGCGFIQNLCDLLQNGIASLVNSPFFPTRIWMWLPNVSPQFWYLALLSPVGSCAAFFMLFTFFLDYERRNLSEALREALAKARAERFNQQSSSQSVGSLRASGDINIGEINQIINNSPRIENWDNKFVRSPAGQIIIAALGGTLSVLLSKLLRI